MRSNPPSSGCWIVVVACLFSGALAAGACGHPSKPGNNNTRDAGACTPGTELCACLAGNACDGNLVCGSGLCVRIGSGAGTGGSGGDPGGGSGGSSAGGSGGGTPGGNLVTNGDFANGESNWSVILNNGGNDNHSIQNGALCATIGMNQSVTLGWASNSGSPLMLPQGAGFTFSYRASVSSPVATFTAKVGHAVPDFAMDFQTDVQPGTSLTSFSHTFTADRGDDNTGIAFIIQGGAQMSDVCVDDVTLIAN